MANTVLCAVDLGSAMPRVISHAVAFATAIGSELRIIHATDKDPSEHSEIVDSFFKTLPYDVSINESSFVPCTGKTVDVILHEAEKPGVELIVIGSSAHGGLARLFLGSSSESVLKATKVPVLLVPPTSMDIVSMDPPVITCGAVLAAVDLAEVNLRQLHIASKVAAVASCPLHLLTIVGKDLTDHDAAQQLRQVAHQCEPVRPRGLIVRRGDVAEEISRCADSEGARLVVMGLRDAARGRPGLTTAKVLQTRRAFVLAVPA